MGLVLGTVSQYGAQAIVPGANVGIDTSISGGNPDNVSGDVSAYSGNISQDGRFVVFDSKANNLTTPSTTGNGTKIFIRDRLASATQLVSQSTSGVQANNGGTSPRISTDGRYVVFSSASTNLVSGDTNGKEDIFIRDRKLNTTRLVSVTSAGTQGNNTSFDASVSADGQYITFSSFATNLTSPSPQTFSGVYVKNMSNGAITLVSKSSQGIANASSRWARISCEGRIITFASNANNLTSGDTTNSGNIKWRTYIVDMLNPSDPQYVRGNANGSNGSGSISCNGNYITFSSSSSDLVPGDTNNKHDIFLYDRANDAIKNVSVDSSGMFANGNSYYGGSVSNDGKYVVFDSEATNLVAGDANGYSDVFIRNVQAGTTELISRDSSGSLSNGNTSFPSISSDGKYVSYRTQTASPATNLIGGFTGYIFESKSGIDYDY